MSAPQSSGWARPADRCTTWQLLGRVFSTLRAQNPALAGEKKKYTMVPPSVLRDGSKKTVFANVVEICKRMHRQPDHVIQYLFSELGTEGSVDGAQRLVIKGRFQPKQIENVLRRYISELVWKLCSERTQWRKAQPTVVARYERNSSSRAEAARASVHEHRRRADLRALRCNCWGVSKRTAADRLALQSST